MIAAYSELFRIDCLHGYFADGRCRSLALAPTAECARLLDRYGCLFRATVGGGTVYSNSPRLLGLFNETAPFAFDLNTVGSELTSYTEIAPAQTAIPGSAVYYFSNLQKYNADAAADGVIGGGSLFLHPPDGPFSGGPLPVKPAQFTYSCVKPVTAAQVRIFDALEREVRSIATSVQATTILPLDLTGLPVGRYQLKIDGAEDYDFYLSGSAHPQRWGMVEIFAGGSAMQSLPQATSVLRDGAALRPPAAFVIALPPRASRWRYYIVSQSPADRAYADYTIAGSLRNGTVKNGNGAGAAAKVAPPMSFLPAVARHFNGQAAWVFESATPIPLYEYPSDHYEFSLLAKGRSSGGVSLPYANAATTRLERATGSDPQPWSEMYVYL
jgi:hypothetical protein